MKKGAGSAEASGVVVVVKVHRVRLDDGYAGKTDGKQIWVDDRLNGIQLMCTLLHELIHIEWGHTGHQPEQVEMLVRYETARRLLPLDRIVGVCKDDKTLGVLAAELGVTKQVLMDRASLLTDAEAVEAGCMSCRKCPAMAVRFGARKLQNAA